MDTNKLARKIYGTPFDNKECHNCSHHIKSCKLGYSPRLYCGYWEPEWSRLHKFDTHEWHATWRNLSPGVKLAHKEEQSKAIREINQNKNKEKWERIKSFLKKS